MADLLRKYKSLYSSTANSFSTGTSETITPASVTGLPTATEITLTFDRVDSSGAETPSDMERIIGTISGGNLVVRTSPSTGRGADGTTDAAHTTPVVEMIWNAKDWNDAIDAFLVEHGQAGAHGDISACDITASTVSASTVSASDVTSSRLITACDITASTVSASTVSASDVTSSRLITASDITATSLAASNVTASAITSQQASTPIKFNDAHYAPVTSYTPDAAATATLDVSQAAIHHITMPAGNITIAISNETVGQCFLIEITQDGTGSRTVTWFSTIKWAGGSAPTLTTTASKRDTFGFRVTGADTYDGFIVGQNV